MSDTVTSSYQPVDPWPGPALWTPVELFRKSFTALLQPFFNSETTLWKIVRTMAIQQQALILLALSARCMASPTQESIGENCLELFGYLFPAKIWKLCVKNVCVKVSWSSPRNNHA